MKLRILFVDDEANIIHGLKRTLYSMRDKWELYFAESGMEALALLEKNEFDVVVTDMRMPQMNGAELLTEVKAKYPHIIRFILSGHSDKEMTVRAAQIAHQFLAKPCDTQSLKEAIEKKLLNRKYLTNENILKIVNGIGTLPSLPDLYLKLEEELKSQDVSMQNVGHLISEDISMTAKILHLVNTSFFGLPSKIVNPTQAVNFLGIDIIRSLVLYIHIFSSVKIPRELTSFVQNLWNHSIHVARLAQEIMKTENEDKQILDNTYIAGLLHDVGKLAINSTTEFYYSITKLMKGENISYNEAEYRILGANHAEIGSYLLGLWGLPDAIIEVVAYHHTPSLMQNKTFSAIAAVHIANIYEGIDKTASADSNDMQSANNLIDPKLITNLNISSKLPLWFELYQKLSVHNYE